MARRYVLLTIIALCATSAFADGGTAVPFADGLPDFPPLRRAAIERPRTATFPGPGAGTIRVVTGQNAEGAAVWWLLHQRSDGSQLHKLAMNTDASGTLTTTVSLALDATGNTTRALELRVPPTRDTLVYRWQGDEGSAVFPIGRPLAPFFVMTTSGRRLEPGRLQGSIVVLNSWATWCVPCVEELPALNALVKKYAKKRVRFVAILETAFSSDLPSFLKKHPFAYTQTLATDSSRRVFREIYPQHVIVGPDGKVAYASTGGSPHVGRELSAVLDRLLSEDARSLH